MSGSWAAGWAVGDVLTATELTKSMGSVFDTTLGAAASSIDITSIPAGYAHLLLILNGRGDTAASTVTVTVRINNDSGANYYYQLLEGSGASTGTSEHLGQTSFSAAVLPAATASSGLGGSGKFWVPAYSTTTLSKGLFSENSCPIGTTTGDLFTQLFSGFWNNAAAVNRITLIASAGNFVAGTRATLYVMGA